MKIHKSTYQQMDELFKEARQEKPLVDIKEVQHIVNAGNYVPSLGTKGFHIGINSFIVVSGIVISSLLTYFTVKQDQPKMESKPVVVATQQMTPVQTPPVQTTTVAVETTTAKVEPALKKTDKVRPASDHSKLLASTDNSVVANDAAMSNQTEAIVAAEPAAAEVAVSKKTLVNQFKIGFDYTDQKVEMILLDGTLSMLTVDGRVIPADEYVSYEDMIEAGIHYNAGKGAELTKYFDSHLRAEKILTSETKYVFELTSTQLLINHVAQSSDVFKRYKKLYEDKTGKVIVEGSVYKFENGATPE